MRSKRAFSSHRFSGTVTDVDHEKQTCILFHRFSGTVTDVDHENQTCTVTFCDGDVSEGLTPEEVLFAPDREEDYGKGDKRGAKPAEDACIGVRIGGREGEKRMRTIKNEDQLRKLVAEKGVIMLFCATWCGPCHSLKKHIAREKVEEELKVGSSTNSWRRS